MTKQATHQRTHAGGGARHVQVHDYLRYIDPRDRSREADLQALARHLYPHARGREPLLTEACRLAFVSLCGYLFDNHAEERQLGFPDARYPTIGAVERLAVFVGDGPEAGSRRLLCDLMQRPFLDAWTRCGFSGLLQLPGLRLQQAMQALAEGCRGAARPPPHRMH